MNNVETGFWEITEKGRQAVDGIDYGEATILELLNEEDCSELMEDIDKNLPNEQQILLIRRIKRYKSIVDKVKEEYDFRCQIQGCEFTFEKKRGGKYAEGHHLLPISEGGEQDKSNLIILCPNHHRMFHYAKVTIEDKKNNIRTVTINKKKEFIIYK